MSCVFSIDYLIFTQPLIIACRKPQLLSPGPGGPVNQMSFQYPVRLLYARIQKAHWLIVVLSGIRSCWKEPTGWPAVSPPKSHPAFLASLHAMSYRALPLISGFERYLSSSVSQSRCLTGSPQAWKLVQSLPPRLRKEARDPQTEYRLLQQLLSKCLPSWVEFPQRPRSPRNYRNINW